MFKKFTALLLSLVFLLSSISFQGNSSAQTPDFEKAYDDHIFTQSQYFDLFASFDEAKNTYTKNKTLSLKEEARKKTLAMLQKRDEMYKVYLSMLRIRLLVSKGLDPLDLNLIETKLNQEVEWYISHASVYKDSDPLEDLVNKSKESESRYKTHTEKVIYQALFYISLGETTYFRSEDEKMYQILKGVIEKKVTEGKLRIDPFNRWFTDIEGASLVVKTKEKDAKTAILKMDSGTFYTAENVYSDAIEILTEANTNLAKLNNFVKELLTSISNQL